jgi:hypothetical protein
MHNKTDYLITLEVYSNINRKDHSSILFDCPEKKTNTIGVLFLPINNYSNRGLKKFIWPPRDHRMIIN